LYAGRFFAEPWLRDTVEGMSSDADVHEPELELTRGIPSYHAEEALKIHYRLQFTCIPIFFKTTCALAPTIVVMGAVSYYRIAEGLKKIFAMVAIQEHLEHSMLNR
jgi:hypothetical protein